jgi:hypothetical protein
MTKRPGYRRAVEWIALNDDSEIGDEETGFIISIYLIADLFEKEPVEVAKAVERKRTTYKNSF